MLQEIEKLEETAELIHDKFYIPQIERMKISMEKNELLLSVMGQFSAGKSRLINHLIGKDVLPVHITETTAVVTLIKYSEEEMAKIIYEDGREEEISIDQSLELWQSGNAAQIQNVETIVLYINSKFLSHGLTIADTPGINTIVEKHVALTAEIMERSDSILYVMGKPATEADMHFMEQIKNYGLSVLIIRTHMDSLKSSEEDVMDSIVKETEFLQQYSDERIFFVSNEENNVYFAGIEELKQYITSQLSENAVAYIENVCRVKLKFIAEHYQKILTDKKISYEQVLKEDKDAYRIKKEKIDRAVQNLNQLLETNRQKLKSKYEEVKADAQEYANSRKEYYLKKADKDFAEVKNAQDEKIYENLAKLETEAYYKDVKETYFMYFDKLLGENKAMVCKELDTYNLDINFAEFVPGDVLETSVQAEEIRNRMAALKDRKEQYECEIEQLKADQETAKQLKENLAGEVERLQKQIQEIKKEFEDYPEYVPEYKIVQEAGHEAENMMRTVGNALDWITVLLPGKAYVTASTKIVGTAGKVVSKLPKAEKAARAITKASKMLNDSEKVLKAAQTIDGIRDTGKVFTNIVAGGQDDGTRPSQYAKENKKIFLSMLDFLTFQHHLGNLGKKFDKKEIKQLDEEHRKRYEQKRQEIYTSMRTKTEEEFKKKEEVLAALGKVKRVEIEEQIRMSKQKAAEEELRKLERELDSERDRRKDELIREHYLAETKEAVNILAKRLMEDLTAKLDIHIQEYILSCDFGITNKMRSMQEELEELDAMYHSDSKAEMEEKLKQYENCLQFCKELAMA